jgi:hypothetical protein
VHAGAKKRLDQTRPVDDVKRCRLQCSPARFMMWRGSALDEAWLHAMTNKLTRRE